MVKSNVQPNKGQRYEPPDIFRAARENDIQELAAAIQDGQSLDDIQDKQSGMTAMHLACIHHSVDFLHTASQMKFDPWIRDVNLRLAIDHARAQGLQEAQQAFFEKMYPPGWADSPVVDFPG